MSPIRTTPDSHWLIEYEGSYKLGVSGKVVIVLKATKPRTLLSPSRGRTKLNVLILPDRYIPFSSQDGSSPEIFELEGGCKNLSQMLTLKDHSRMHFLPTKSSLCGMDISFALFSRDS